MTQITEKNGYEIARSAMVHAKTPKARANALLFMHEVKKKQDKQIILGGLCRIHYKRYLHDPSPLALYFPYVRRDIRCVPAINLHYLPKGFVGQLLREIKKGNRFEITNGRPLKFSWADMNRMGIPKEHLAYRLYKWRWITPVEYIPISDWESIWQSEKNPFQGRQELDPESLFFKALNVTGKTKRFLANILK